MNLSERVRSNFQDSVDAVTACMEDLAEPVATAAQRIFNSLRSGQRVLVCGNGGSAADAQHFSAELLNRYLAERPALGAVALTSDGATLTAIANDEDFSQVFARQVRGLGRPGDLLLLITTSGNSANLVEAVAAAREQKMSCIALTGRDGGELARQLGEMDLELRVGSDRTPRIQEVHGIIIHCLCDLVDQLVLADDR
ncbi:MAG: SIS domain-containing protein [Gammaproteobacteria bacterium]|jgi:D-sedoheptulose 7-phosphate isomerase|nr:SIS domain-containing protein [Gammaproteobacteria bacterium]